jgi:hypothetical protein
MMDFPKLKCLSIPIIFLTFFLDSVFSATERQCYWPDGTGLDSPPVWVACNATADVSVCCAENDACTTNGWCLGSSGYVYRGGCTDPSWTSSVCQQQCKQSIFSPILLSSPLYPYPLSSQNMTTIKISNKIKINTANPSATQNLYPCSAGVFTNLFCCGGSGDNSCCSNNFTSSDSFGFTGVAFMPAEEAEMDLGISTAVSAAVSTVTATTIATFFVNATSGSGSVSGVATGGVVGAAIGSAIVGGLLGLLAGFLMWRKSRTYIPYLILPT